MRPKTKSKDQLIEELEAEKLELAKKRSDLILLNISMEGEIGELRAELEAERERYADLLERYIKTMERMVRIDEQRAD
jgi:hypothetical protein